MPRQDAHQPTDIIDGSLHPELFLVTEILESAVSLGLLLPDQWQQTWACGRASSGLPSDFWDRLARISAPYLDDLRRRRELMERARAASRPERAQLEGRIAALEPTLCFDRAAALASARDELGEALDRFLYETVAAGKASIRFDGNPSREELEAQVKGCR